MTALIPAQNNLTALMKVQWLEINAAERKFNAAINPQKITFGENLRRMKPQLQHGQWQHWLAENFNLTDRTARNYMRAAEYFGVNSPLKTENVFRFQFAALIELTTLEVQEVSKFLSAQKEAGVDVAALSVRQLQKAIKDWKNPALPLTVDVQAEISTAPLKLAPPKKYWRFLVDTIPTDLTDAAFDAGLSIELNFRQNFKLPQAADAVLITVHKSSRQYHFYSKTAACVVVTRYLDFRCGNVGKYRTAADVWYFGNDTENFVKHFGKFGSPSFFSKPLTQKSPSTSTGEIY